MSSGKQSGRYASLSSSGSHRDILCRIPFICPSAASASLSNSPCLLRRCRFTKIPIPVPIKSSSTSLATSESPISCSARKCVTSTESMAMASVHPAQMHSRAKRKRYVPKAHRP